MQEGVLDYRNATHVHDPDNTQDETSHGQLVTHRSGTEIQEVTHLVSAGAAGVVAVLGNYHDSHQILDKAEARNGSVPVV